MTRDLVQAGYRLGRVGELVAVWRPGETEPALYAPSVPEALRLVEVDRQARCADCVTGSCACLPA